MDHISHVLPRVLQKRGIAEHAQAALVVHRASTFLKEHLPEFSAHVRVTHVRDGVLTIECDHPIAAQECHAAIPSLHAFLQESGGTTVKDIRLSRSRHPRQQGAI